MNRHVGLIILPTTKVLQRLKNESTDDTNAILLSHAKQEHRAKIN